MLVFNVLLTQINLKATYFFKILFHCFLIIFGITCSKHFNACSKHFHAWRHLSISRGGVSSDKMSFPLGTGFVRQTKIIQVGI